MHDSFSCCREFSAEERDAVATGSTSTLGTIILCIMLRRPLSIGWPPPMAHAPYLGS